MPAEKERVQETPGWQVSLEECAHVKTADLTEGGTNKVRGGVLPGPGSLRRASLTLFSMSQVIAPMMQESGRMCVWNWGHVYLLV